MPTIDARTWRSPNHSPRPRADPRPRCIILHSCEGKPAGDEQRSSLPWLCKPGSGVSSHYYVRREDAPILQLVDDDRVAWCAGKSHWPPLDDGDGTLNDDSLNIEIEHRAGSPAYTAAQIENLRWLVELKMAQYGIPQSLILAHRWVSPRRKSDPTDWSNAALRAWIATLVPRGA
jgi:N-acetylmuramoyl-L-alanine amidase